MVRKASAVFATLVLGVLAASGVCAQSTTSAGNTGERNESSLTQSSAEPPAKGARGVQFVPFRGLLAVAQLGTTKESSIEIVNRAAEPLEIYEIENPSERFTARLETLTEGRRYRLTVTLEGKGPVGKKAELIYLTTNLENHPKISVPVHTDVRHSVYTFPKSVYMGRMSLDRIQGDLAKQKAQILMVYRKGTTGFEAKVTSDIPFLKIESEQGPDGDRWESTIWLDVEKAEVGDIEGNIVIETNDSEVPRLEVPVTGRILAE